MCKINASITPMREIALFQRPALFTPYRVDRTTVHLELYCYEIQARRGHPDAPFVLAAQVETDFFGTVLTAEPVADVGAQRILKPGDLLLDAKEPFYTPAEFEDRYSGHSSAAGGAALASTAF